MGDVSGALDARRSLVDMADMRIEQDGDGWKIVAHEPIPDMGFLAAGAYESALIEASVAVPALRLFPIDADALVDGTTLGWVPAEHLGQVVDEITAGGAYVHGLPQGD